MNSYIHGMMKDATDSLVPPKVTTVFGAVDRTADVGTKLLGALPKALRQIGFDPAELTAQVALWKFAKHRWEKANPDKDWDTPNHRAEIHRNQILLGNTPATRAGMMPWQDGLISSLTQFMGQPHRSMMQMFSSPQLTAGEKARLAGGRLVWYGAYGAPYGAKIGAYLEAQVEDEEQRKILQDGLNGLSNLVFNGFVRYMADEEGAKQKSSSEFGKSLATVPDKLFAHDAIVTAYQVLSGEKTNMSIAPIKASGAVWDTITTLKDTFAIKREGLMDETSWTKAVWSSVSFAFGFSDYEKAILVASMSKQGKGSGYEQTRGEAIVRLWGIPPTQEVLDRMVMVSQIDRTKHVTDMINAYEKSTDPVIITFIKDLKIEQEKNRVYMKGFDNGKVL